MQNYYIPCAQPDRPHGNFKGSSDQYHTYRRPSVTSSRQIPRHQWTASGPDSCSSTPSLAHSSASSQEDELSPGTPGSSSSDDTGAVDVTPDVALQRPVDQPRSKFAYGGVLPSRPKNGHGRPAPGQPIIQETAVRSRLARHPPPTTAHDLGLAPVPGSPPAAKKSAAVVTLNSRCHARRRAGPSSTSAGPPKLKRDTDCTDAIVRLIVCFSTKLVHAIWSESASTPRATTAFNGAGVLPLRVFIQETLRRSKTSYSTLQVALFYLILLKPYIGSYHQSLDPGAGGCRALQCGRRMFLTALILASKYLQDRNYSSRAWSKISGLPIAEINENERRYLNLIQFNLHMKKETFENWSKIVLSLCKAGEVSMNRDLAQEPSHPRPDESSDTASAAIGDDEARPGSERWWRCQLTRLTSDLVHDSRRTEDYLASLTASKAGSTLDPEQLIASLDTPPSSPDSTVDMGSDKSLDRLSSELGAGHRVADPTASPASVASLPSRPSLPNLPTPQTTPRYARTLPPPRAGCHVAARCRDSSRALVGLDRQAVTVANLETCPPPQPKAPEPTRSAGYVRREGSCLVNTAVVPGCASSPESTVSDASWTAPRSRSSSMSSTTSVWWPSGGPPGPLEDGGSGRLAGPRREAGDMTVPAAYSFYHPGGPASKHFEDEGVGMGSQMASHGAVRELRVPRFQDEGYGSDASVCLDHDPRPTDADPVHDLSAGACSDESPAEARTRADQTSTADLSRSRKHKRDRSSASEDLLHHHVRHLLWSEQPDVQVRESSLPLASCPDEPLQYPAKEWACTKQPITNGTRTKRFAMHHDTKSCSTDLASLYLRDEVAMVS